jgi:mannose-1-phosphate guanylyltransferase/mannose-1-phosphate guanylyltransferase/mannose-6-phosphate isomerase
MSEIVPVILCGGSGTRLWPSSRKEFPKQFSNLVGNGSLFQQTIRRLSGPGFEAPVIMTNDGFRFLVRQQLADLGLHDAQIVLEPVGRDTAPAILAAALLSKDNPDRILLVAPSDHLVRDTDAFLRFVEFGKQACLGGNLVTFGITPDYPETGFGYLELSQRARLGQAIPVSRFTEKPDAATAQSMIDDGHHLWNAGIFMFRAGHILNAFETLAPDMMEPCTQSVTGAASDLGFMRLNAEAYASLKAVSIDYAVMERAKNVVAIPAEFGWSDLGSWTALYDVSDLDADGVATDGNATAIECEDTLLRSEDEGIKLVGLGLKNIVAVAMRDAVLVADMAHAQKLKQVVDDLRQQDARQADEYPRHHRPWGWYETLCLANRFQVKRIMVKPGAALSLQSHVHRSEHWVVVEGTARVTLDETVTILTENQSTYIPVGSKHRLENPGRVPMYLIEVQTGSYLGEDDIERYEDIYARS